MLVPFSPFPFFERYSLQRRSELSYGNESDGAFLSVSATSSLVQWIFRIVLPPSNEDPDSAKSQLTLDLNNEKTRNGNLQKVNLKKK